MNFAMKKIDERFDPSRITRFAASDENVRQKEIALRSNCRNKLRELSQILRMVVRAVHSGVLKLGYHKIFVQLFYDCFSPTE